jgi:hypothetical protein
MHVIEQFDLGARNHPQRTIASGAFIALLGAMRAGCASGPGNPARNATARSISPSTTTPATR